MQIQFNGESVATQSTLLIEFLSDRQLSDKTGIAVALNETVIPRSQWDKTPLQENDSLLIITAAAGG